MSKINTVTGAVPVEKLGRVLIHEHITFGYPGCQGDSRYLTKEHYEDGVRTAVDMCRKVKTQGIQTIVDATTNDCARNPEFLKRVSEEAEINIICTSGYYFEGAGSPAYFKNMYGLGRDAETEMYELFVSEITNGIGDTGIKPGLLKASCSLNEITEYEEMVTRTVGKVAAKYNMPVITHTFGTMGDKQAAMLINAGVHPEKIMIGHSCDSTDMRYLLNIAEMGVYIGYDRWGHYDKWAQENGPTDKVRMATFMALVRAGYGNKLMCSHDCTLFWQGAPMGAVDPLLKDWVPMHFIDDVVPELKKNGITDSEIDAFLIENPKRFFGDK